MRRKKSFCPKCKEIETFIKPKKYFLCTVCGWKVVDYSEKEE